MEVRRRVTRAFLEKVFSAASKMGATEIALWLDWNVTEPEVQSARSALERFRPRPRRVEPVTRYDEDIGLYKDCVVYRFGAGIAKVLLDMHREIAEHFDSISFYGESKRKWTIGLVFHENLTVVRGGDRKAEMLLSGQRAGRSSDGGRLAAARRMTERLCPGREPPGGQTGRA